MRNLTAEFEAQCHDEVPAEAIQQLTAIAKIPAENMEAFARALPGLFLLAREDYTWKVENPKEKHAAIQSQLDRVKNAAAKLLDELRSLDSAAFEALWLYAALHLTCGDTSDDHARRLRLADLTITGGHRMGAEWFTNCMGQLDTLQAAAGTQEWPKKGRGTHSRSLRIPSNPHVTACDIFIYRVVRLAGECGGVLTLDKNIPSGSLVDFLILARLHLPAGAIPEALSGSRLDAVLSDASTG
jgi:hypothetical protein